MTNIYFCDVCNESVPQADLDLGRALVVKGRIICAICDRAMTLRAEARAHTRPANLGLDLDEPSSAPAVVSAGPASALAAPHAEPLHPAAPRGRGSSGVGLAFAVGVCAVCAVAVLWQWTREELGRRDELAARATQMSTQEQATARRELERVAEALERRMDESGQRALREFDEARQGDELARSRQMEEIASMRAQVAQLETRVEGALGELERLARLDRELIGLQQRYSALGEELGALSLRLGRVEASGVSAPPASVPGIPAPSDQRPAWFELTHLLESPNSGDRWQGLITLGETRDPACAPYIAPLLRDKDVFIRMTAARMLGDVGGAAGIEPLIDALGDVELTVRESAIDSLRRVTKRSFDYDAQAAEAERSRRAKQWREWWAKEREKLGA